MATALSNLQPLRWVHNSRGVPARVETYPEGTSETFKTGDLVTFDLSEDGLVSLPMTSGVPTSDRFLGIAMTDASGTAGTAIDVLIPQPDDVFSAAIASAVDTAIAPLPDHRGALYAVILMDSSNNSVYAVYTTGTEWVKVFGYDRQDAARRGIDPWGQSWTGTAGDRVYFSFLTSCLDAIGQES